MKKILVTGAEGFIGSHLVEQLLQNKNNKVKAMVFYNSFNSIGWLKEAKKKHGSRLKIITGDICDYNFCLDSTKDTDLVYHLASLISIPYSYQASQSYINTNIIGTHNICYSVKVNNVKKLIFISTSEVYGSAKYVPIDEKHPLQPQSPYSASKIGAEAMALSFYKSFSLPLIIVRPFNTFGPRQSLRAIVPTIILQFLNKNDQINVGNLSPTRDLNYVQDTCLALIKIDKSRIPFGEVVNIGSGKETSIKSLINSIQKILKIKKKIIQKEERFRPKNSEVYRLVSNNKKLYLYTKFKSKFNLEKGLTETIKWYKKNLDHYIDNIEKYNI